MEDAGNYRDCLACGERLNVFSSNCVVSSPHPSPESLSPPSLTLENKEEQPGKIEQGCGATLGRKRGKKRDKEGKRGSEPRGNRERGKEMTGNKGTEKGAERQGRGAANRRPSSRRGAFRSVRRPVSQTRTDSIPPASLVAAIACENYEGSYFTSHCAPSDDAQRRSCLVKAK